METLHHANSTPIISTPGDASTRLPPAPTAHPRLVFHQQHRSTDHPRDEILAGLRHQTRYISPKFLYDETGAELFDRITEQPEYYLTRTERQILLQNRAEMCAAVGTGKVLIEPGSGVCEKVELLLEQLQPSLYIPLDISERHLHCAAQRLVDRYPWLRIQAVSCDYTQGLELPDDLPASTRLLFFPGSTLGNFEPAVACQFLSCLRQACGADGALLIGVDLRKDATTLNAAYNDRAGMTAAFNLNILRHVNRLADGDFDPSRFRHRAFFNEQHSRIEMHLESLVEHDVTLGDELFHFAAGETIHTENSYKYTVADFQRLSHTAGFALVNTWCDDAERFSVNLLRAA